MTETSKSIIVPTMEAFEALKVEVELLKKQVSILVNNPSAVEWYTVEQASIKLNRCKNTVRNMAKNGKLVYKQAGRRIEISAQSIQNFIMVHTIKP